MNHYVVLLRGVMPTGKNRVPMGTLKSLLTAEGFESVQTYIQTGNILLSSELEAAEIEKTVHRLIKKNLGADIVVFARSFREFELILKACPFENLDGKRHYCTLLSELPDRKKLNALLAADFSPDRIRVVKDVIYTEYASKLSESKFNNSLVERALSLRATTRNTNTMQNLVKLIKSRKKTDL